MTTPEPLRESGDIALSASGVSKVFGHFRALAGADLTVRRGTVHALLGGNGSGKSTLIKCLAGVYTADGGEVVIAGRTIPLGGLGPAEARALGLRFVHQDLGLFPQLSIAENVALGRGYPTRFTAVRQGSLQRDVQRLLDEFEIEADSKTPVASLRPSQRAMVAIARALDDADSADSVLMLDEPTAALGEHDAQELMRAIRRRAATGQTVVLVSHRFNEIASVADDITVFRDGHTAGTGTAEAMPLRRVVSLMTGAEGRETPASVLQHEPGPTALRVEHLAAGTALDVSFDAGAGEVLGLVGLDGAGQADVLSSLFGVLPRRAGSVTLEGAAYDPRDPRQAMQDDVALVPQDRLAEAAFVDMSVAQNITISVLERAWNGVMLLAGRERKASADAITAFGVRAASDQAPIGVLSGGNQQKVIVARWLQRTPRLLLLVEPTQGVDVVARQEIHASIAQAARDGATVLVVSSDLDEVLATTHRVAVVRGGRVVSILATREATRDELTHAMMTEELVTT